MRLPRHFVPRNDDSAEFLLSWWEKVRMGIKKRYDMPWHVATLNKDRAQ